MAKVVVPVLCSSGKQYRAIYQRGVLKTFANPQKTTPQVIPYFGVRSSVTQNPILMLRRILTQLREGRKDQFVAGVESLQHWEDWLNLKKYSPDSDGIALRFPIEESSKNFHKRFLVLLNWLIETKDFDFIWHSNVSTYLNLAAMESHLEKVTAKFYYAGVIGDYENYKFVSGASVCLSRETVKLILDNSRHWDFTLNWDVSLGKLLSNLDITPSQIERVDVSSKSQAWKLGDDDLNKTINFRCKSGRWIRRDYKIMRIIHKRLRIGAL